MKTRFFYLVPLALGLSLASCKKDDDSTPAKTKTELLTGKNWVVTAATVSPGLPNPNGGAPITDLYAQSDPCDRDDFIRFDAPNAFKEDEGANRCNTGSTQTRTGTWVFGSNETVVTIAGSNLDNEGSYNIAELAENTLKVTQTERFNNVNYTITITYAKQ